jgi:hypothetical protein
MVKRTIPESWNGILREWFESRLRTPNAHTAATEFSHDAVVRNGLAD